MNEEKVWTKPSVEDHGDVIDLVQGIGGGGGKEPGGLDGGFGSLQIS